MKTYSEQDIARIGQLKQLIFARQSFDVAIRTCELALAPSDDNDYLPHIYSVAASISYASPFLTSNGLPALDKSFTQFQDPTLNSMHKELMEIRHSLYAHKDVATAKHFEGGKQINSHEILFDYYADGRFEIKTFNLRLEKSAFSEIKRLAQYQILKLDKKVAKVIKYMLKLTRPSVGQHIIGETFP